MKCKYLYWLILGVSLFITIHLATAQDCEERQEGNLEEGRSCRKPCGNNKDCNKKKNRKCICDDTCGMSCIGPDAVCQNPGEIDHGTVEFDALKYKSVATYSCDEGYTIQGKSERKCRSDGMWAGTAPKCLKRACPFPERRGVAFPETNKEIFEVGDAVTYSCRYGYTLSGNSEVECQADDTWSVPEFLCNKVSCGDPGAPLNGFIEAEDFKFGSWATYKCDEGYEVSNPAKARRYCSSTETWSGEPITCNVKNCGAPDIPEHGDARAPSFDYQSIVTYSCNQGYKLQGNKEGTCRDDNTWGEVPTCIVDTDCNFDSGERPMCGYLNRGVVEWRREFLRANTRDNLPGYVLTYDGVGSSSAVLISPTIPRTKSHCLQFYYYTEGQITEDDVRIKVNTRNVANLVSEDVTNPEFRWVGFQTTMRPNKSEDFDLIFEIVAEGRTRLSIDDIAVVKNDCPDLCREVACHNGGTCVGEIDNAYCSCTQFYTGKFCEKEITCEKPSSPEHGSFFAPDTLTYGSKIIYSCEQGFEISGASTATCGSGGQLSEFPPTCQRILVYDGKCPQEYERHKLMCYRVYEEKKSYSDAEETCKQQGARLAVVQSKSVNDYLYTAIPSTRWQQHTYWIGLKTTDWRSTWSSQAEFLQISDIAYNIRSLRKNGCGAYFYRGRGGNIFDSDIWGINFNDCNSWNRFICEKWSKGTSSFKVDTPGGGLSGVYKPVAGLLTTEERQVYRKTENGSTKCLFYHWNKGTNVWGWFLGEYYVELSKPGPWIFKSRSDIQFPNLLISQWRSRNGYPVQVTISIAGITGNAGNGGQIMCPGVRRPYHGEVAAETERVGTRGPYPVHTVINFSCDKGYSGIGASRATCMVNGRWSNPAPYCVDMSCKRKPDYIEKGRKCRKKCEKNTDCNRNKFQQCLCDDWCGKSCYNPSDACPLPEAPDHGRVVTYGSLIYGQAITYECDDRHILSGEKTRRCRSDLMWTGYAPKCVAFDACGQAGDTGTDTTVGRIIRGKTAAIGAWPWQAVLLSNNRYSVEQIYHPAEGFGGGSVINKHWILTAGHIFDSPEFVPYGMSTKNWEHIFLIVLGMTRYPTNGQTLPKGSQIFEPSKVFRHDSYVADIYHNDVALVKIGRTLKLNGQKFVVDSSAKHGEITYSDFIRPVCLPCLNGCGQVLGSSEFNETLCAEYGKSLKSSNANTADVVFTGFGSNLTRAPHSENYEFPGALLQARLRVLNDESCAEALTYIYEKLGKSFKGQYTKAMICAQSADKKIASDSCQGDSGGPLVRKVTNESGYSCWTQIGIVSWGMGCGQVDAEGNAVPGYYTDVTSVLNWIVDTQMKGDTGCALNAENYAFGTFSHRFRTVAKNAIFSVGDSIEVHCPETEGRRIDFAGIVCREDSSWHPSIKVAMNSCE